MLSHFLVEGGGLPDPVLGHQTRRFGCQDLLQTPDHPEVHVPEAAVPHRHRRALRGPRAAEGLPRHQPTGTLQYMWG